MPDPGEYAVSPDGSTATPGPMVPLLNTGSGTSPSGTTVPASGERISVTTPARSAASISAAATRVSGLASDIGPSRSATETPAATAAAACSGDL